MGDFLNELRNVVPGDTVAATIIRDDEEQTVTIELGRLQP